MNTVRDTSNPLYQCWANIKKKCTNPNYMSYERYGGRGISFCARWERFDNFLADMGPYWSEGLEIDRINNDGNYEPSNCRWVTRKQNNANRSKDVGSSKFRGVRWHTRDQKWEAIISIDNKTKGLGYFSSEEAAARVRDEAIISRFGPEMSLNFPLIRIRDDDILVHSSSYEDTFGRFKQVHEWVCASKQFIHVPTILIEEIQEFPECIRYIRDETEKGRMLPEIHGLRHIDYAKLDKAEIVQHLNICKQFLWDSFGRKSQCFMTPWGANAPHIFEAAEEVGLQVIDCSAIMKLEGKHGIVQRLRDGEKLSKFYGCEFFTHFWAGGARLKRIVEVFKHGSWAEAKKANRELFRD